MTVKKHFSIMALLGLVVAIVAVAMATIAVMGYRGGELHFVTAIKDFEWATYTAGVAFGLSLIGLWFVRPDSAQRDMLPGLLGLLLSLPLVIFIVNFEYTAHAYPAINDITTDTEDPPTFWDVPNPMTYPGEHVAELQKLGYPDLKHLEVDMDTTKAFKLASDVAKDMGWEIVAENTSDMQIEAIAKSVLFGFEDYVVVRLQYIEGKTRIDVRSHSRLGRIDRGVNAKRIRTYLKALVKQVAKV